MNRKKQKIYRVVAVIFGASCYFYAQADLKRPTKVPLKALASSTGPTAGKKPPLVPDDKKSDGQAKRRIELEGLKRSLKVPGQEISLKKLLHQVNEQAERRSTINLAAVTQMFSSGTKLGCIESVGTKYFANEEEFLTLAAKQANKQGKLRVADILNIRVSQLKGEAVKSIAELLKKHRRECSQTFYWELVERSRGFSNIKDMSKDELVGMMRELRKVDGAAQKVLKEQDEKFDLAEFYQNTIDIAQSFGNSIVVVYVSDQLEAIQHKKSNSWVFAWS